MKLLKLLISVKYLILRKLCSKLFALNFTNVHEFLLECLYSIQKENNL